MVYFSLGSSSSPRGLIVRPVVSESPDATVQPTILVDEDIPTFYYRPKWSPDGRWIAFYRHNPSTGRSPGSGEDMDVCVISASGGELHFLAQTGSNWSPEGLSWSPDGKELAFERWNGKNADIFIVSVATRKTRPFTIDGKANMDPVWSGDGRWITYLSRRRVGFGRRRWIQALDGGKSRISDGSALNPLVYSPDGQWVAYFHFQNRLDNPNGFYAARVNARGGNVGRADFSEGCSLGLGHVWQTHEVDVKRGSHHRGNILQQQDLRPEPQKRRSPTYQAASKLCLYQPEPLQWLVDGETFMSSIGGWPTTRAFERQNG